MEINEFQDYLRGEVVRNVQGTRNESTSMLHWLLVNVFDIDIDYAKSIICDGHKDKGIDGIYVDSVEEIIYVFQAKYKENNDRHIGDKVLRDFSGVKSWFVSSDTVSNLTVSTINSELKALLKEYQIADIVEDYKVEYHFVSNAFINDDSTEFLAVEPDMQVWDIESLMKHYHLIEDDPMVLDTHTFEDVDEANVIELALENGLKTLMIPIKAEDLLKLKGIDDLTLFSKNVRYGLGNTRVNKSIKKTIKDDEENKNFLLFHNGVSMVCENFEYDRENNEIVTTNYSVVNGAQSLLSFYKESSSLTDDIKVLLRVTQVGDHTDLIDLISRYNNNQNSISMKDLRSKDKIQNRLTKQFDLLNEAYSTNISYSAKRGKAIAEGNELILSDYAGQLIESCYLQRSYNIHLKASMFDSRYNEIFSKNTDALKLITYYNSHNVLKESLNDIEDTGIADYGLAQHFLLMTLFDVLNEDASIKSNLRNETVFMTQVSEWNESFNRILSILIKGMNMKIRAIKESPDEDFVYKNYFKSKEKVKDLQNQIKGAYDMTCAMNNTSTIKIVEEVGVRLEN